MSAQATVRLSDQAEGAELRWAVDERERRSATGLDGLLRNRLYPGGSAWRASPVGLCQHRRLGCAIIRRGLLIDCEEDRTLRAVLVGMLREAEPESN